MTVLDGDIGELVRCDRCQRVLDFRGLPPDDEGQYKEMFEIPGVWRHHILREYPGRGSRLKWLFGGDYCRQCAVQITPLVYRLHDICDLFTHLYRLEKAIHEQANSR